MQKLIIKYTRKCYYEKEVEVSDALAKRLLALDGDSITQSISVSWGGQSDDLESVPEGVWKADDVSNDNFTMIAEDLTGHEDIYDSDSEIEDVSIEAASKE